MARFSKDFYRSRAISRRRDPDLDARLAADSAAMRERFNARLAEVLPVELLAAEVERRVAAAVAYSQLPA